MTENEYIELYERYVEGKCTPEEEVIINQHHEAFQFAENEWDAREMGEEYKIKASINKRLNRNIATRAALPYRLMAAAVLLIVATAGFYFITRLSEKKDWAARKSATSYHDVLPGGMKAVLTLADGSEISLNDSKNGLLAKQGSTTINKARSGRLTYLTGNQPADHNKININTLTTPAGGQYQVKLPDGTNVWLNASSSLRFPTAFAGKERDVELVGEAYFEVAKNPLRPFKVKVNHMDVTVLGTHFNVNAYPDEKVIHTTLLEGSVKLSSGGSITLLKPGQRGSLSNGGLMQVKEVDAETDIAWKNGWFVFNKTDIQSVMRQVARWYNVDIIYQSNIPDDEFVGKISRKAKLSEVLKLLELTDVHFRIDDKKVTILP